MKRTTKCKNCGKQWGGTSYSIIENMKKVAKRLGHKKSDTVDRYVHIVESMKEQLSKRNLFNQALRHIHGGKPDEIDCWEKRHQLNNFSSIEVDGPVEI